MLNEVLTAPILASVHRLALMAGRSVSEDLLGSYRSAFRGTGLRFREVREYQPGDDIRHIHWKASARTGRTQVKQFEEERSLRVMLVVDRSSSMAAERSGIPLHRTALEFSAIISLLAQRDGDALGACTFADEVLQFLPPERGRRRALEVLAALSADISQRSASSNLNVALKYLNGLLQRRAIVIILSDFVCPPFEEELLTLALRHEVVMVAIPSFLDFELPRAGVTLLRDPESGDLVEVDLSSARVRERVRECRRANREAVVRRCNQAGAVCVWADGTALETARRLFARRDTGRRILARRRTALNRRRA